MKIALICLLIITVIGIFTPEKYLPKQKKQTPLFKNRRPKHSGGLRWFGNRKRARRNKKKY